VKQIIEKIANSEKNNIERVYRCIDHKLLEIDSKINGLLSQIVSTQKGIEAIFAKESVVLQLSHIEFEKEKLEEIVEFFMFDYKASNRFLLFYVSKLYEGTLKFSDNEKFIKQLKEKLEDLKIKIDKTTVAISPSYQKEDNFLFKIEHDLLKNVYFSIVKFSPKGYKFYFFYDLFSMVFEDNIDNIKNRVKVLQKEYHKYKEYYKRDNIQNAIVLKSFQKRILSLKDRDKKTVIAFENVFLHLDKLRSKLLKSRGDDFSKEFEQDYRLYIKSLNLIGVENHFGSIYDRLKKKLSYIEKSILNFEKNRQTLLKNIVHIKEQIQTQESLLSQSLRDQEEMINRKIEDIRKILKNGDLNYEKISKYQSDVPSISKIGIIEERIKDLQKIILENRGGILGKIKEKITSYRKELLLEEEKLKTEKQQIADSLNELIKKLQTEVASLSKRLQEESRMQVQTLQNSLEIEEERLHNTQSNHENSIKSAENEYDEIKDEFLTQIHTIYKRLDKEYLDFKKVSQKEERRMEELYKSFLTDLKHFDANFIALYSKIEMLYDSLSCNEDDLPEDIQKFLQELKKEKNHIVKALDIKTNYNRSLREKIPLIKSHIDAIMESRSLSLAMIESIEDRFVNNLKLLY
jgi:hypothetical protein